MSDLDRVVALFLAAVWLTAGMVACLVGLRRKPLLLLVLGPLAIWYGLVWIRVWREKRRVTWSEMLRPWKRS